MRIPQEILDSIINEVALSGPHSMRTLKTCALSSRHFLHCCRKHIFHTVSLSLRPSDTGEDTPTHSRLCDIVEKTPVIAEYIRSLYLSGAQSQEREWGSIESSTPTPTWINTRLGALLDKLPNVVIVFLAEAKWDRLVPSIQQAIFKIMCSPRIDSAHVIDVRNLPPVFVECLQGIPSVRTGGVVFLPDKNSGSLYKLPPGFKYRLSHLYIPSVVDKESDPLLQLVSSTSHHLKTLQLDLLMNPNSTILPRTHVAPIAVSRHGTTLKELVISGIPSKLDLSHMTSLEILTISPRSVYLDEYVSMKHLTDTLATISVHNRIREIDVSIPKVHIMARREGILTPEEYELEAEHKKVGDVDPFGELHGGPAQRLMGTVARYMGSTYRQGASPLPQWKRLDEILAGSTFPKLEHVNLSLMLCSEELKGKLVERLLPRLHDKGNLLNLNC